MVSRCTGGGASDSTTASVQNAIDIANTLTQKTLVNTMSKTVYVHTCIYNSSVR